MFSLVGILCLGLRCSSSDSIIFHTYILSSGMSFVHILIITQTPSENT